MRSISFALSNPGEAWRHVTPFVIKRCGLCDEKKRTKHRLPTCKRPAAFWTWENPEWLLGVYKFYVCKYHHRLIMKGER